MIDIKDLSFQYENGSRACGLSGINLSVKKGEVVLLCGESGCGKTTLTRLINGLIPHFFCGKITGKVLIKGIDLVSLPIYEIAKHVGSVFQNPRSQFYCMDTNSELAFGCENMGLPAEEISERIDLAVEHFNISGLMNRSIFKLSGGEKQKIACGSVHAASPDVIVLDEPSSNLDAQATMVLGSMVAHWKKEGKTIIIAEHRLHYLRNIADRMVLMNNGRIDKDIPMSEARNFTQAHLSTLGLRTLSADSLKTEVKPRIKAEETIHLSSFQFSYKAGQKALDIASLDLPKGYIIGITGSNGAGKTTFARCLCGLNKRFNGTVRLGSITIKNRQCLKNVYMVMQDVNHQLFTETVLDEVLLSMNVPEEEKALSILKRLNLGDLWDVHPMSLSGGQKQRVAIASAIASERDIIIFDEPTSGLDLRHMIQVSETFKQLKNIGKTLIIITHDPELIQRSCDYLIPLNKGCIRKEDSPPE